MLSVIMAVGENYEIGRKGKMPWHIPKDLQYFKQFTAGSKMVMGRKTFESLPGVLPGRKHIILTKNKNFKLENTNENVSIEYEADNIMRKYLDAKEEVFVIGGAQIIDKYLPFSQRLYLTHIYSSFEADTYLSPIDLDKYQVTGSSKIMEDDQSGLQYKWVIYKK